ncbi:class II fructose-bisphosphate aldolase [Luteipulveratus flavus]|uniref:Class II fructose-bisphosphate aldolase family protein n=1 Tax=Luteipulveratus flavus TaxID=3031728 RepID=A0ABT6C6E1_9MICO|nr:class II fructose-bisphosphate aldolase [Luteipulveratus sp. YIM 133296]MDF8263892.1 class II fructose-bisphosphate aldolase family protein [Luteipulveratus sp. YIM 133296]
MTLASLDAVLMRARADGRGVGAFNVIQLEHAHGLVAAAERTGLSVVLQISENAVRYHGSLVGIGTATRALAEASTATCVVHLDHATDPELVRQAIDLGLTSVMFDGSTMPDAQNRDLTAEVVSRCHRAGVSVEAELGEVGGKDGVHAPGARTDPDDAAAFVADTGVDALAVAVGSSHAMTERSASLDLELIARLRAAVPVPLVLHGSSGVPDAEIVRGLRAGLTKINVATHLNAVFTDAVRSALAADERLVDTRRYLGPGRDALRDEAARLLQLLALLARN